MDTFKTIQNSIDYIEENLKTDISAQELSDMAGFSLYHYYKLFQRTIGMPVMQYILRRKLLHAIYEISYGEQMIDVSLAYGFDTYAGFYKAFKREIGYTPSEFLKKNKVRKPYRINLFEEEHIMMTHKKITELMVHWNLQQEEIRDIYYDETGNRHERAFYIGNHSVIKFSSNLGELKKHIDLTNAITNAGLLGASIVKTSDGQDYIFDNGLYFCVTKRLNGTQIKASELYKADDVTYARFIGEIIGQLHLALKNIECTVEEVDLYDKTINWALPKAKEILGMSKHFYDVYLSEFSRLYPSLPLQTIHRDPNPGNIIVSDNKWGFIDFELSERNIRIYDPCYAATAILSETYAAKDEKKLRNWIEVYKNILYGYDSIAKVSEEEMAAVPYVLLANQFVCIAWFADKEKYRDILNTNVNMTRWLIDNFEKLEI